MRKIVLLLALMAVPLWGAENLKLNSHLDYSSDSQDGPLITGDHMEDGPPPASRTTLFSAARVDSIPSGRLAAP